jgi:hypothetical protein
MRNTDTILAIHQKREAGRWPRAMNDSLESRMHANVQVQFGGGRLEKGRLPERHLASRLPYKTAVQNWRRALGVGRTDNEGTARLLLAAADKGAEAVKARGWTEDERGRRRRNAVEKDLGRNLVTGYHGPLWTAEEVALLGTAPDEEVARRIGRTPNAVRVMRDRLGIPRPAGGRWREEDMALLGVLPDREVARKLRRSLQSVTQKRIQLGIANPFDGRRQGRIARPAPRCPRRPEGSAAEGCQGD